MEEYDHRYPQRGEKFSPGLLAYEKQSQDPFGEEPMLDEDPEPWGSAANRTVKQYTPISWEESSCSCSWPCCMVDDGYQGWSYGFGDMKRVLHAD